MADESSVALLRARKLIKEIWGEIQPHAALVCGSGWGKLCEGYLRYPRFPMINCPALAPPPSRVILVSSGLPNQKELRF